MEPFKYPGLMEDVFDDDDVLDTVIHRVEILGEATLSDWKSIEPVIFGTLFERGLIRQKESKWAADSTFGQLPTAKQKTPQDDVSLSLPSTVLIPPTITRAGVGIHYTDTATIMKIVETVVLRPLRASWEEVKEKIQLLKRPSANESLYYAFREQLQTFGFSIPHVGLVIFSIWPSAI